MSSLFGAKSKSIDLDLGCLFELKDGRIGAVQALGDSFGSYNNAPYVYLDGDDRTGTNLSGENLFINGDKIKEIERILVYTFIYEGATNWREADGKIRINVPEQEEVLINMDDYNNNYGMCALAMIENINDSNFSVEKLVRFFDGHQSMDEAYSWGLNWVAGRK
ncbi:Tellurium resistance [Clostridium sp. OS1-26]|uniref:Tellurium resistance n=1 Tax=Clostridium sp. OS1-26 TaxID=3070681 RepID=UPI0027DF402C|nr:Tellurium resistance [Clostridium sp. OS1-26]WML36896.1 Tellurium resistance [Clostridium sp. OS1-26]